MEWHLCEVEFFTKKQYKLKSPFVRLSLSKPHFNKNGNGSAAQHPIVFTILKTLSISPLMD
jgi:hypothetical protein